MKRIEIIDGPNAEKDRERMVTMVLNPNGIEPTFFKLDSWTPGAGFIPISTSNILNYVKKKKEFKK